MKKRSKENVLDSDECNEIVQKKLVQDCMEDYSLISYEIIPLDSTTGYMGEYFTLKAIVGRKTNLSDKKTLQFFAKLPPLTDSPLQNFNLEQGSFKKEIDLYTKVFPQLLTGEMDFNIPRCILGLDDNLIVLEDMSTQGYKMTDKFTPFDFDHCKIMMSTLAKFHAKSLIFEEVHKKNLNNEFSYCLHETLWPTQDGLAKKTFHAAVKGVISMIDLIPGLKGLKKSQLKKKFIELSTHHAENLKPSKHHRNVICHGDLWANNILFQYDNQEKPISCCLIDFQLARYNPPAHDVMCFLNFTTTRELRKNCSLELYKIYYDQLIQSLKNAKLQNLGIISWEDFNISLKDLRLTHLLHGILNLNVMILHPKILGEYFTNPKLLEEALYVDRTPLICAQFRTIKEYRERMIEIIFELHEEIQFTLND
ncbi:uncharacterized protein [Chelonus insularis]|uniref:uncharacterized protein n=1 Tax=Chelonus insularis TaxID=460826 RepID=UPI00158ED3C3|nr:uncharacterized protein LOC118074968 [Chelonus insularis]XP_034952430.1 uncharacterized protein LOC118074968 [Chelonus insularis]XP_034952431.1 uncharacterized protein LOC118074968 [Chelonus insularis]